MRRDKNREREREREREKLYITCKIIDTFRKSNLL
jgi:hypothetical protein